MTKRTAFTLVELLVVISIITLLAGMVIPSLQAAKEIAKVTRCATNLHAATRDILIYAEANDGLLMPYRLRMNPATGKLMAPETPWATTIAFGLEGTPLVSPDNGLLNDARNLGYGYTRHTFGDYNKLYCPDQPNEENTGNFYPRPWGSGDKMILAGYMYNPNVQPSSGGQTVYMYRSELELMPNDRPLAADLVYGEKYRSHAVGAEWKWNVARVNGDVQTAISRGAQEYMVANPAVDLPGDWSLFNSKVYNAILMQ